jgi:uncharacterized membrane protein
MIFETLKDMSHLIYHFLESFGYKHPLHPVMVHLPIGLSMGALLLCLVGILLRKPALKRSAYHALVLASLFSLVALAMGLLDWQHYFNGALLTPIRMKLFIAFPYTLLMLTGAIIGYRQGPEAKTLLPIYVVGVLCVMALGYFGGELTFTGRSPAAANALDEGQSLFEANCSSCHPSGGNRIVPDKPIRSSRQLENLAAFTTHVRNPSLTTGRQSIMPAFSPDTLSEPDMAKLYAYILHYLDRQDCVPAKNPDSD